MAQFTVKIPSLSQVHNVLKRCVNAPREVVASGLYSVGSIIDTIDADDLREKAERIINKSEAQASRIAESARKSADRLIQKANQMDPPINEEDVDDDGVYTADVYDQE